MNREEIKGILPHREPMLLVDTCEIINNGECYGTYYIIGTEHFLQGHYPNNPIVPGVILCEIMAQCSCLLFKEALLESTPYFASMNNVKFRNIVVPNSKIEIYSKIIKVKAPFYTVSSYVKVKDKVCAEGELTFALVKNK